MKSVENMVFVRVSKDFLREPVTRLSPSTRSEDFPLVIRLDAIKCVLLTSFFILVDTI